MDNKQMLKQLIDVATTLEFAFDDDVTFENVMQFIIDLCRGIRKGAKKLAYIHQHIDLNGYREELHDENYWETYMLDGEWEDSDIGWNGYEMKPTDPNQSETPTSCDHTAEVSKKVDLIDRRAATQACLEFIAVYLGDAFDEELQKKLMGRMNELPSAQPDVARDIATIIENEKDMRVILAQPDHDAEISKLVDSAYTEGYTYAESKYRKMWDEMPEIIRCRECKYAHLDRNGMCKHCDAWTDDDGYPLELYVDGDFYCGNAERRTDETTI